MKINSVAFLSGVIFALGLAISGMTQPPKVISFLDIFGTWDPSLGFVMAGAIGIYFLAYLYIKRTQKPWLAIRYYLPEKTSIDSKIIFGSALFGIGWGMAGFCPGPAIVSLITLRTDVLVFVGAMAIGMMLDSSLSWTRKI